MGKVSWEQIASCIQRYDNDREFLASDSFVDGGTMMLFARLERAALNQFDDGESTVSRYAIWANTVRDYIRAAMSAPDDERQRLLTHASNSLSAFSEIQSLFDSRS